MLLFRQQHAGEKRLDRGLQLVIAYVRLLGELCSKVIFDMFQASVERLKLVVDTGYHVFQLVRVLQRSLLQIVHADVERGELLVCPVDKIGYLRQLIQGLHPEHLEAVFEGRLGCLWISQVLLFAHLGLPVDLRVLPVDLHDLEEGTHLLNLRLLVHIDYVI